MVSLNFVFIELFNKKTYRKKVGIMIDTRINERKADELISSQRQLTFRLLISNKKMVEHIITPVILPNEIIYRDKKNIYLGKVGKDISINSNKNELCLLDSRDEASHKGKGNTIKNLIIELLKMDYQVNIGG